MIVLKSAREIEQMRRACRTVAETLARVRKAIVEGATTQALEDIAEDEVIRRGVVAAFKGVRNPQGKPYPACLCVSVDDEVVHGIPRSDRILRGGELVSIDFGVFQQGFFGDAALSVGVGGGTERSRVLIRAAEEALAAGIAEARPGRRLGNVSAAIQEAVESAGFTVVREFVGHGIGRSLHEDPQVANYGSRGTGVVLRPGMVLAIEPMINDGAVGVLVDPDGWTARTRDGSLAAHAEHTVAITQGGPDILSRLD